MTCGSNKGLELDTPAFLISSSKAYYSRAFLALFCALFFFGYAYQTTAFTTCVNIEVYKQQGQSPEEYATLFYKGIAIVIRCLFASGGNFIFRNKDSIAAISTAVVAVFTISLWKSTDGLHKAAILQSKDMKASIRATEASAAATHLAADAAVSQIYHLEKSVIATEQAAEAAMIGAIASKESADAFINSKRPHFGISSQLVFRSQFLPTVHTDLINMGESLATVSVTKIEIHFGRSLPTVRKFRNDNRSRKHWRIVRPDKAISHPAAYHRALSEAEYASYKAGESFIFFFGYVIYYDTFENRRERGFASRYSVTDGRFIRRGNDSYIYDICIREESD